eukprot:GFUD01120434.1.p1 GENE.GFUD01120434.1~~GFUD01120434.1.p1  ORF type:complete len:376 (-),score=78.86 GFUD01120434.1:66-1193(-)
MASLASFHIAPQFDEPSVTYRQKLAWKITEENWTRPSYLVQDLSTVIPGSFGGAPNTPTGGRVVFGAIFEDSREVKFMTNWLNYEKVDQIHMDAIFNIKSNDGETIAIIEGGQGSKNLLFEPEPVIELPNYPNFYVIRNSKLLIVNPVNVFDESRSFTFEAELLVEGNDECKENQFKKPNSFVKDMQTILHDSDTSDIVIVTSDKEFKCHKNILSARCDVFKNMLSHETIETETSTITLTELPADAVAEVLKYIYTGEIPNDPELLSFDLLHVADYFQLAILRAACAESILASLDVPSCISTFIRMDRFLPQDVRVRERLIMFMKCKAVDVIQTDDWEKLVASYPSLVTELTRAMVMGRQGQEKHKCQFCVLSYI